MLISVAVMALLLSFWMADSLSTRSLGAAAEVCSGTCEVEGQEYDCYGIPEFCMIYHCCNAEDMPCTPDEVTATIRCISWPVGEYPGDG